MRAFVFPGQGAQAIGMGRALADAHPAARAVFDEVDDALGEPLSRLIWEGEAEALQLTRNAQPALMATSIAALRALASFGTEAAAALLRVCFEQLGLRRAYAQCFADNAASWRVMEKLGMRREEYAVRDSLHRSGEWRDAMRYAILADEWRAARPPA